MIQHNTPNKLPIKALVYSLIQAVIVIAIISIIVALSLGVQYLILILAVLLILIVIYQILYWNLYSFVVSNDSITINSGVIFRSSKSVNYNDLQSANVKRGPLLMLLGLAKLEGFTSSPQQLVISGGNHGTSTTFKPDVHIILLTEDAQEAAKLMKAGDVQRVQHV